MPIREAWNKGKKMPHTKEWEENRLSAVRNYYKENSVPRGYKRAREYTEPMRKALEQKKKENPEKYKQLSINNLPKTLSGNKNPNWKGGKTAKTRGLRFSNEYRKWKKAVLKRDGRVCRICSSTENINVHHIVPMSACRLLFDLVMNGLTVCKKCHYEIDEAWKGERFVDTSLIGKTKYIISTIPHSWQEYPTVGNWASTKDGVGCIFVSEMGSDDYEFLVMIHELIEFHLCKKRGITDEAVSAFDINFEKEREKGVHSPDAEPGDSELAPYFNEHQFATKIERQLAEELGVNWDKYNDVIVSL